MSASEAQLAAVPLEEPAEGLHLLAVVRTGGDTPAGLPPDQQLIGFRDLAALTRVGPFAVPEVSRDDIQLHQQALDRAMQRWTLAPAPCGIVFPDRESVLRFLETQYEPLSGALQLLEGRWEFRLHIREDERHDDPKLARDVATHIYAELRRLTRAAIPFPREGRVLLSAAFLVDRAATGRFLERVDELSQMDRGLGLDVTGPWPAYDFVRMQAGSERSENREVGPAK